MGTRWNYTYCKASSHCKCDKNISSVNENQIWSVPFLELFFFLEFFKDTFLLAFKSLTNVRFPRIVSFISSGGWKPMTSSWIFSQVVVFIFLISRFILAFSYHLQQSIFFTLFFPVCHQSLSLLGLKAAVARALPHPTQTKKNVWIEVFRDRHLQKVIHLPYLRYLS